MRAPVDAGDGQVAAIRAEGMVHRPGDVWSRGKEDPVLQAAAAEAPNKSTCGQLEDLVSCT